MYSMPNTTHSHLWPGVPFALGSAILFGASTPLSKYLLGSIDPWMLAGMLYFGAGIGLLAVRSVRNVLGIGTAEASLSRADYPWLAAVVVIGGMIGPLLLMFGLSRTTAGQGALLLNLEGLATMGIAWLVFRENVDWRLLIGAFAILSGAAVLAWNGPETSFDTGGLLIAAACLAWGIDNNLTRKLSSGDPVQIAMIKGLFAGGTNLALAFSLGATVPSAGLFAAGGAVGFFGIGVSLVTASSWISILSSGKSQMPVSARRFIEILRRRILLGER